MKGFVSVTKDSLLAMLAECREVVASQVEEETKNQIDYFVDKEKRRSTTRWLFGIMPPSKPRFAFDAESVKAYAASVDYPMFEGDPFSYTENDAANSLKWIARLERVAMSEHSGEPIQIDMKTFMRISEPARYYWARAQGLYYSIRD